MALVSLRAIAREPLVLVPRLGLRNDDALTLGNMARDFFALVLARRPVFKKERTRARKERARDVLFQWIGRGGCGLCVT